MSSLLHNDITEDYSCFGLNIKQTDCTNQNYFSLKLMNNKISLTLLLLKVFVFVFPWIFLLFSLQNIYEKLTILGIRYALNYGCSPKVDRSLPLKISDWKWLCIKLLFSGIVEPTGGVFTRKQVLNMLSRLLAEGKR